jgi:hypothetical protein
MVVLLLIVLFVVVGDDDDGAKLGLIVALPITTTDGVKLVLLLSVWLLIVVGATLGTTVNMVVFEKVPFVLGDIDELGW